MHQHPDDREPQDEGPSKSQLKRDAQALRDLGERLVNLPQGDLEQMPLPDELRQAVDAARSMNQRGARRRQLQFIGKLLRRLDAAPIQEALSGKDAAHYAQVRRHHELEDLTAALVAGDEDRLGDFLDRHPDADRQHIRQLIRNAQREQQQGKPPKSRRQLFRALRDAMAPVEAPPSGGA